jgi:hypothetical protein
VHPVAGLGPGRRRQARAGAGGGHAPPSIARLLDLPAGEIWGICWPGGRPGWGWCRRCR